MKTLSFLIFFLLSLSVHALEERWINFDWEPVPGANSYEIELLQEIDGKILSNGIFKTELPEWNKPVAPGKYFVKIRTLDKRNVGGDWSERLPISIRSAPPTLEYPQYEESIEILKNVNYIQKFSWKPSSTNAYYKFQLYNSDNKIIHSEITEQTDLSYPINTTGLYFWNVSVLNSKYDETEQGLKKHPFSISYGKLSATDFRIENTAKNVLIVWSKIKNAEKYQINFSRQEGDLSFKAIVSKEILTNKISIPKNKISNGTYRFTAKARGNGYADSDESEILYEYDKNEVKIIVQNNGNEVFKNERPSSGRNLEFFIAVPTLDYQFKNFEADTISKQSLSGTAIELGWFSPLATKNLSISSNLKIMSLSDTYASSLFGKSSVAINKSFSLSKFELLPRLGIFAEKTPAFLISRLQTSKLEIKDIITAGPLLGITEQYKLTQSLTLFAGQQFSYQLLQLAGMEDNTFKSSMALDLDLGVKYFFKSNFDLLGKISYKKVNLASSAKVGNASYAQEGDENSLSVSGIILSAGMAWFY